MKSQFQPDFTNNFSLGMKSTQVKKIDVFSPEKTVIHGVNLDFSELNVGSWAVQGSWATFSGEKTALHGVALEKRQYTV